MPTGVGDTPPAPLWFNIPGDGCTYGTHDSASEVHLPWAPDMAGPRPQDLPKPKSGDFFLPPQPYLFQRDSPPITDGICCNFLLWQSACNIQLAIWTQSAQFRRLQGSTLLCGPSPPATSRMFSSPQEETLSPAAITACPPAFPPRRSGRGASKSVTVSCLTLCDPVGCSPPGLRPWDF